MAKRSATHDLLSFIEMNPVLRIRDLTDEDVSGRIFIDDYAEGHRGRESLSVPLKANDKTIGILNLEIPKSPTFSAYDRTLLRLIGQDIVNNFQKAQEREAQQLSSIEFEANEDLLSVSSAKGLSNYALIHIVVPYVSALCDLQVAINRASREQRADVGITEIRKTSPLSVSLSGANEAVETLQDMIVPWRRKHARAIADLGEEKIKTEIEEKRAEIVQKRAIAERDRREADKLSAEAAKIRAETEAKKIGNERAYLALHRERVELASEIISKFAPNLHENERLAHIVELLRPLETLTTSDLLPRQANTPEETSRGKRSDD